MSEQVTAKHSVTSHNIAEDGVDMAIMALRLSGPKHPTGDVVSIMRNLAYPFSADLFLIKLGEGEWISEADMFVPDRTKPAFDLEGAAKLMVPLGREHVTTMAVDHYYANLAADPIEDGEVWDEIHEFIEHCMNNDHPRISA